MPEDEIAGIYLVKKAEEAFYALSPTRQKDLADFLNGQRHTLKPPKKSPRTKTGPEEGYSLKNCAYEWEPGCIVYWDVNLKPNQLSPSVTHISSYRIEVLLIETND